MGKLDGPNPRHVHPSQLNCKSEYLVFALGEGTVDQAIVGSTVEVSQVKKIKESGHKRPRLRAS